MSDNTIAPFSAKSVFPSYTSGKRLLPEFLWDVLRLGAALGWVAVAVLLWTRPAVGLQLLWGVIVPLVPLLLILAPGLWRQICPLAFVNQLPRRLGFAKGGTLPEVAETWAYAIAVALFVAVISLRQPIFNKVGWPTGSLLLLSLVAAFAGGIYFRGRSGWCGTFCPLGPIQRTYGQAPAINVSQSYCPSCVGCQKNCYDLNPKAAIFDDLNDDDPRYAGQRKLFMGMMPGLVLAYFAQGQAPAHGYPLYLAILLGATLASVGLYQVFTTMLRVDAHRCAAAFAATALVIFYWYSGPIIVDALFAKILGLPVSNPWVAASRLIGLGAALILLVNSHTNAKIYLEAFARAKEAEIKAAPKIQKFKIADKDHPAPIFAQKGETLLEAMLGAGVAVHAGCKAGLCGSDAVLIGEGHENLSPPSPDELATLKRLGLEGQARLACCCRVSGAVSVDRNLKRQAVQATRPATTPGKAPVAVERLNLVLKGRAPVAIRPSGRDRALFAGIERVVIVGNGIAGVTAADELRSASPAVSITMVSVEGHHFYNRMAINKIAEGRRTVDDLVLQPRSWYAENRIDVKLNCRAVAIDRRERRLALSNGQSLPYDKLILATGGSAEAPNSAFLARENCFVLRTADDAEALRRYMNDHDARSCVVLGGGVLAVEAAESMRHAGLGTSLLARSERIMNRNIDDESSQILRRYLESLGINVLTGLSCTNFIGEGRLDYIELGDQGQISADVYIAGLGSRPNIDLALQSGLETKKGVLVNRLMMTSDQDIFAVGDVAEMPGAATGLWPFGVAQARTAVSAMLGNGDSYVEPSNVMRLKSQGIDLRTYGSLHSRQGDDVICAPPFSNAWWRVIIRNNRIVGAVHAGPMGQANPIWKFVDAGMDIGPYIDALREGRLDALEAA